MQCPKCKAPMEEVTYTKVIVDRCTNCKGLWFEPEDIAELKERWMSEYMDIGNPAVGRKFNQIEDIKCPVCGKPMDKLADEKQTHIWYEACPDGHGIFFDAGEFTDWKHDTFMDRFRSFFRKTRPTQ